MPPPIILILRSARSVRLEGRTILMQHIDTTYTEVLSDHEP